MNSSLPSLLCRYRYDPLDRLTSHVQSNTPQRHRFYCESRLATEIQGANGYSIVQHGDLLLAQQQCESGSLDTTLLATDLQRSVLHTHKKNAEPHPIAYSPYGHRSAENGLTSLLGFNGERSESETGHYLLGNGYRAFNPVMMRFNSPDSLSPFGKGGLNSYAYCNGDPRNFSDHTGHIPNFLAKFFPSFSKTYQTYKANRIAELENLYQSYRNQGFALDNMRSLKDKAYIDDYSNAYAPYNEPIDVGGANKKTLLRDQRLLPLYESIAMESNWEGRVDFVADGKLVQFAQGWRELPKGITQDDANFYLERLYSLQTYQQVRIQLARNELRKKSDIVIKQLQKIKNLRSYI
jgi:RHS repeat-associated protein